MYEHSFKSAVFLRKKNELQKIIIIFFLLFLKHRQIKQSYSTNI